MSTALYLKNRLPHSSISTDKTPHELWFGTKPSLSHLCIFGCSVYIHIPMERRQKYGDSKVDFNSQRHYFVGYDPKADSIYSVWDPTDDSVHRARNVIFDETL